MKMRVLRRMPGRFWRACGCQRPTQGVIPQDDTFMAKPAIDLSAKAKAGKQTILLDYSRAEVNEMQILKQADVVM